MNHVPLQVFVHSFPALLQAPRVPVRALSVCPDATQIDPS